VKLEEFKSLTKNILENLSDQAKVSELLMQLLTITVSSLRLKPSSRQKSPSRKGK
jgi:hypothetical protein